MSKSKLEKDIQETRKELDSVIKDIELYKEGKMPDITEYNKYIAKRDNLAIQLNYYQNQIIIELLEGMKKWAEKEQDSK